MATKTFVPLYRKIYLDLKQKIEEHAYEAGQQLPCERELCRSYGVERVTVRKALELLVKEGLIEKRTGIGSFVADKLPAQGETGANILFVMRQNQNDIRHNTTSCNTKLYFCMEQVCRQNGYLLSYVGLDEDSDLAEVVREHAVRGVFLVSSYQESSVQDMVRLGMPTVLMNHYDPRLLSIMPDNQGMLKEVVSHLARKGHKRIAYIDGMPESCNAKERWEGFKVAMYLNGLDVDPELYFVGNWTMVGGEAAAQEMLKAGKLPTAVFAASDMMAAGAMDVFRQNGVRVPEDISVISYDNLDIDAMLTPPLSSATVDFQQMCEIAFEHLRLMMQNGMRAQDCYTIRMPARLIQRSSVCEANREST